MALDDLPILSEGLIDKLLNGVKDVSTFFNDFYKYTSAKNSYLEKIGQLQYVKTLNDFEETVSLYDFYVPPFLINSKEKKDFQVKGLSDIKTHRKILISGIVGQGKSILMRHLAINEVLENSSIPLFYELRCLSKGQNVDNIIKHIFSDWLQVKNNLVIDYILKSGKVTLFLDGFDEIHIDDMSKIVIGLEGLIKKYPKLNIIVSSRPENVIEASTIFQNFQIKKLDFNVQKEIIRALIKNTKMQNAVILGVTNSKAEIRDVLITPLMVNLFVFIYKNEQIVPEHVKDFYDRLFDLVLRKHDNTKIDFKRERATQLDTLDLKKILQLVSYMCCKQQVFAFSENILRRLVDKAININGLKCTVDALIFDLTSVLCFIVKEGYLYAFIHKSIPEYFAAEFIRDHGNFEILYEELFFNYSKYENVCVFLNVIDEYNFNKLFLHKVFDKDLETFKSRDFINRAYFKIDDEKAYFWLVFDINIHDYFYNDVFAKLNKVLKEDIKKNFKKINSFQLALTNRNIGTLDSDKNMDKSEVYTDYFDSILDKRSSSTISDAELEEKIINGNFKKINSVNLKQKFSQTLSFLNSYHLSLNDAYRVSKRKVASYQIDDFSF
jgi:hypothetical protein